MNFKDYIQLWIKKAEDDIRVVDHEMALSESEWVTEAIGFHCQQAIEKLFKAILIAHNQEPAKTHNLEKLHAAVIKLYDSFNDINLMDLTDYAVESRYPGDSSPPTIDECKKYREIVNHIHTKTKELSCIRPE